MSLRACFIIRRGPVLKKAQRSHRAGFSLIEVVVAILILGVALAGLTEGITAALRSSKESEVQTSAVLLAEEQMEMLRAQGDYSDGESDGDFGSELPLYRWRQTISQTAIDGLHEVQVTVENAQTGQALYELRTLLFETPQESQENVPGNRRHSRPARNRRNS